MTHPGPVPINTDTPSPILLELMYRLKVRDVMTTSVVTITPEVPMRSVQETMRNQSISGVPVIEGRRLVGIVSMDDVIRALDAGDIDRPVAEKMTRTVIVLEDDMPVSFAISYLEKYHFGRFPVLDAGKQLVGVVTSRDIITSLLVAMHKEIERYEAEASESVTTDGGFRLEHTTRKFDFELAGRISTESKRRLTELGVPMKLVRRVAVACYELEMNQVVHSDGGSVQVIFDAAAGAVRITAADNGPGIPDIDKALEEGYSTATEWIRSLGFGAGMGLPNVRRVADELDIRSNPEGTTVRVEIRVGKGGTS